LIAQYQVLRYEIKPILLFETKTILYSPLKLGDGNRNLFKNDKMKVQSNIIDKGLRVIFGFRD